MTFMNENNWEHLSRNGTTFKHDRCDFAGGPIKVHRPWGLDPHSLWQDIAEMIGYHGVNIHPRLNGFAGYDCIGFEIIEEDAPVDPGTVISETETRIVVAFPMGQMGQTAPADHLHEGKRYKRGSLTTIPDRLVGDVCSCREYNLE